jgi:hypothetical protein
MKRRILGKEILFDDIIAVTDFKHRMFSANIRQVSNTGVSKMYTARQVTSTME